MRFMASVFTLFALAVAVPVNQACSIDQNGIRECTDAASNIVTIGDVKHKREPMIAACTIDSKGARICTNGTTTIINAPRSKYRRVPFNQACTIDAAGLRTCTSGASTIASGQVKGKLGPVNQACSIDENGIRKCTDVASNSTTPHPVREKRAPNTNACLFFPNGTLFYCSDGSSTTTPVKNHF